MFSLSPVAPLLYLLLFSFGAQSQSTSSGDAINETSSAILSSQIASSMGLVPTASTTENTTSTFLATSEVSGPESSTASVSISSPPGTIVTSLPSWLTTIAAEPTSASFVPIGSIPRDYSPEALEQLWNLVGPVEEPPFTTTVPGDAPVTLPASAPPVYPTWYAPTPQNVLAQYKLPTDFLFGVATAAYQVEGATKLEGKGPTGWDWGGRQPGTIMDGTNGDINDLQYLLYKTDTARLSALGFNAHSFSISWARIFPFGTRDSPVNQAGLDHYADLINYSNSQGIKPVVTLFHWDIPLALSAYYGGMTSDEFVADYVHYAKTIFTAYNGSVGTWYTFNEPNAYCSQLPTYPFNTTISSNVTTRNVVYQCSYYLLKAHAKAVKAFREMGIQGEIAYKNDGHIGKQWRTNTTEDALAVERSAEFHMGLYCEPIYGSGDWPELVKEALNETFLPRFTEEEKAELKGSADFFAIDLYTSGYITAPPNGINACLSDANDVNWPQCNVEKLYNAETNWPIGIAAEAAATWLRDTPQFVRYELGEMNKRWPSSKIYISEFGFLTPEESQRSDLAYVLKDASRVDYFMTMLGEILLAIHEDNIPVMGTFAWSMVDNAEWNSGHNSRFGIQYVNYTSLERTFKYSALALSEFYNSHAL